MDLKSKKDLKLMNIITFSVSLVRKKGNDLKKPKTKTISCNSNETLHDLHLKVLNPFGLPDIHHYAFYLKDEPFKNLDYEWGGSSGFNNPSELIFRTVLNKVANQDSEASEDEVVEYVSNFLEEKINSSSNKVDIPPLKDASEKLLSSCSFKKEDIFHYIYDFGDNYLFSIRVAEISTKTKAKTKRKTTKKVKSKTKKVRKKINIYQDPYENKINKLIDNFTRTYPDEIFKEIVNVNDDEFTYQLLRTLVVYSQDYFQDFYLTRFFSSSLTFSQLCSLFLNQIQLQFRHSDVISSSFLTFSSALYCNNQPDYEKEFKNLLMKLLFLYFEVLNPKILDKFIYHFKNVFDKNWNVFTVEKYWKEQFSVCKLNTLIKFVCESAMKGSSSDIVRLDLEDDEFGFLFSFKVYLFEKPSYKSFLYPFFLVYPEIVPSLVNFILDPEFSLIKNNKNWVIPLVEMLAEHSDHQNFENLLHLLLPFIEHGDGNYRFSFAVTCWLISKDLKYIRILENDNSIQIERKIDQILDDPEKYRNNTFDKRKKFWSKIKSLRKNYQNNQIQYISNPDYVYVLKITLKGTKVSRTIGIIGGMSLYDLHIAIQDQFDFDDDHLYGFFLNNKPYSNAESYYSPDDDQERIATKKPIYDCNFYKGKEFLYIFDFGDDIRFKIEVEDIRPKLRVEENFPKLISKRGKSPEQYPDYF